MIKNDMISYDELYKILYEKYKATHDEIKYWVKISKEGKGGDSPLIPYRTDLELNINNESFIFPAEGFLYPEYCFYKKEEAKIFKPLPPFRFVYLKDLTAKRNWNNYNIDSKKTNIFELLKHANEFGILRLYDPKFQDFTFHRINKNQSIKDTFLQKKQLWCHTFEGESYLSNPDSFFLLHDILIFERIFFKKDWKLCMQELFKDWKSGMPHLYEDFKEPTEI